MADTSSTVRDLLLARRGLVFLSPAAPPATDLHVRAVELDLAELGYVLSSRLRQRLAECSLEQLAAFRSWATAALAAHVGSDRKHEPLFRRFPEGVPQDTEALWWAKVLIHFLQAQGQPCLLCGAVGTTHVLNPCRHVVCDHCFDGSSYSACPCCEHHVDRSSPFFQPAPARSHPVEKVVFKRLDLGASLVDEARAMFVSLCERKQALSPADKDAFTALLAEYRTGVLPWIPNTIPVRENVAIVFGSLLRKCSPDEVMPHARRFLTTATDVLRLIAVMSGTDGSLLRETIFKTIETSQDPGGFWQQIARRLGKALGTSPSTTVYLPVRINRFKTARLPRPLRRALLGLLEAMEPDRLIEDMLRHQSYWVWVGEFLHPHEYAARYPSVARAFQIARKKAPDGTAAPAFATWNARLERAVQARDADSMVHILSERPGELARHFDHALRVAADDVAREQIIEAFSGLVGAFSSPVLLTLRSHLPTRAVRAPIRVYWPKARVAKGVSAPDERETLPERSIAAAMRVIDAELLKRFSTRPEFPEAVVDESLSTVIVPFNERTASRSAVSLPRGSRIPVPEGKLARLFLHWCQPASGGRTTDLDLSVAIYDASWKYLGVCSYYELKLRGDDGAVIAQSAGDLRDAPWPDGATEFVDLHMPQALAAGARYAVMVVNAYAGMPFNTLERAFAGLMFRDDAQGAHFDPRTVELKFTLEGDNGVYLPLVLDLRDRELHWLDIQQKGEFIMNNVESSKAAIANRCPELMTYFATGVRCSMYELALLHAAARCRRVVVRGAQGAMGFERREGETNQAYFARMMRGEADTAGEAGANGPVLAVLYRGDMDLPEGSSVYALFRERVVPTMGASDLI